MEFDGVGWKRCGRVQVDGVKGGKAKVEEGIILC